jgi:hypothetical protein
MYRMKGRISRTPLLTVAIAVRKFMTVPEIDRAFCINLTRWSARWSDENQPVDTQEWEGAIQARNPTNLRTESGYSQIILSGTYK